MVVHGLLATLGCMDIPSQGGRWSCRPSIAAHKGAQYYFSTTLLTTNDSHSSSHTKMFYNVPIVLHCNIKLVFIDTEYKFYIIKSIIINSNYKCEIN